MTMLTGRPGNFVRIPESQYKADIAAAEERGRASASQTAQPTSVVAVVSPVAAQPAEPTQEEKDALAQVKALQAAEAANAADDPKALAAKLTAYIADQKKSGRNISYAKATQELQATK